MPWIEIDDGLTAERFTRAEGWLATGDSKGEWERETSVYSWDNHAILVA
jgi:hypothetical protein